MFAELAENGFVLWRELTPTRSTMEVATALGRVVDVGQVLPASGIPTVQSLRPRDSNEVSRNQYSGHYGFGEFPLHSDLAHWAIPPRYFLLRCIAGEDDVFTRILPWRAILSSFSVSALQRAVFAGRKRRFGCSGLVRAMWRHEKGDIFRWDSVFLKPLNTPAQELDVLMRDSKWSKAAVEIPLCRPGDTILIDNWRALHGRSRVPVQSAGRLLERVYFSEVSA
jgi:L-asparagine oxygenase